MHSKHRTTIICADHTKWSHQIQRYDNSLSKLGLIPTFNSWVKKKKKTFICDTFEYDTMVMKFWLDFWECWAPPIWCSMISWAFGDEKVPAHKIIPTGNWGSWKTKQSGVRYSILYSYLIDVGAILYLLTKNHSIFKSCMRTWPSGCESALTPVYFNDKVKLKWLSSVL